MRLHYRLKREWTETKFNLQYKLLLFYPNLLLLASASAANFAASFSAAFSAKINISSNKNHLVSNTV